MDDVWEHTFSGIELGFSIYVLFCSKSGKYGVYAECVYYDTPAYSAFDSREEAIEYMRGKIEDKIKKIDW